MNKVCLIGNLTKDPELSTTTSGICVCRFVLAVSRRFTNADGNRETDFLPIIAWKAQGESCAKYLKKGSRAAVVGYIQTRTYEAPDGTRKYSTEIVAEDVQFLSTKEASGESELPPEKTYQKTEKKIELKPVDDEKLPF